MQPFSHTIKFVNGCVIEKNIKIIIRGRYGSVKRMKKYGWKKLISYFTVVAVCIASVGICEVLGNKSTPGYAAGDDVVCTKQIEKNADGSYSLSLDVENDKDFNATEGKVDVVLVIDTSNSMQNAMNGEKQSSVTSSSRISVAKKELTKDGGFIDAIAKDNRLDVNLSVVAFASDVRVVSDWQSITDNETNINVAKSDINAMQLDGATLTQGGIRKANELFNTARAGAKKIMILVTDGVPTLCYSKKTDVMATVECLGYRSELSVLANGEFLTEYESRDNYYRLEASSYLVKSTELYNRDDTVIGSGSENESRVMYSRDHLYWDGSEAPGRSIYDLVDQPVSTSKFRQYWSGTLETGTLLIPREKDGSGNYCYLGTFDTKFAKTDERFCYRRTTQEAGKMQSLDAVYSLAVSSETTADYLNELKDAFTINAGGVSEVLAVDDEAGFSEYFKALVKKIDQQVGYGINIKDTLSDYVNLANNPNYRAEVYDADGNLVSELKAGDEGYPFKSVVYDGATRSVTATFKDGFILEKGYRYRLKFDVAVNENAYYTYFTNVQAGKSGYPNTGSEGSGDSSAGKEGFYSNKTASVTVSYGYDNPNPITKTYKESPVVQINSAKSMTIRKVWEDTKDKDKKEIRATLTGTSASGKKNIAKEVTLNSTNNWEVTVEGLPSQYYTYVVTENTELPGFYDETVETKTNGDGNFESTITNRKITFEIKEGNETEIYSGESVDIKKLAFDDRGKDIMTEDLQNLVKNNPTLCGKVTYQWIDANGNNVGNATTSTLTTSSRVLPEIPSYTFTGTEAQVGTPQVFSLKVTFENTDGSTIVDDGDVKVNVKHTIVPTGFRDKLISGLLAGVLMGTLAILSKIFLTRKKKDDR